jgi:hypothetical protein
LETRITSTKRYSFFGITSANRTTVRKSKTRVRKKNVGNGVLFFWLWNAVASNAGQPINLLKRETRGRLILCE